jgi:hypothetical protein
MKSGRRYLLAMSVTTAPRAGRTASMSAMISSAAQTVCGLVLEPSSVLTVRHLVKKPTACCLSVKALSFQNW